MSKTSIEIIVAVVILGVIVLIYLNRNKTTATTATTAAASTTASKEAEASKTVIPEYDKDYSNIVSVADGQATKSNLGDVAILSAYL